MELSLFGGGSRCWVRACASGRCFLDSYFGGARANLEQPIQAHCGGKLPLEQLSKPRHQQQTRHHQQKHQLKAKTNTRKPRAKHKHNKQPTNENNKLIQQKQQAKLHNKNTIENIQQKQQTSENKTNNDYINLREQKCEKLVQTLLAFVPPLKYVYTLV